MKEVQLFHNNKAQGGLSKGCGFVFFAAREGATAAIDAMNEKVTMEVTTFLAPPMNTSLAGGF